MKEKIVEIINSTKELIKKYFVRKVYRKVKIETLLKAKLSLEEDIDKDCNTMVNIFSKKSKAKTDLLTKTYEGLRLKELQLVYFKLAQQKANLKTHLDGTSNFAYIYQLGNLKKKKEYLDTVKKKITSLKLAKEEHEEPNRLLNKLVRDIQAISTKLSNFNKVESIRVQVIPSLNLL